MSKATSMRRKADKLIADAHKIMEPIPAGQPVLSTRDRNRRERAWEKIRAANELYKAADQQQALEVAQQ